jgi:hypothetical protein
LEQMPAWRYLVSSGRSWPSTPRALTWSIHSRSAWIASSGILSRCGAVCITAPDSDSTQPRATARRVRKTNLVIGSPPPKAAGRFSTIFRREQTAASGRRRRARHTGTRSRGASE